jgi:hypothetical protein
MPPPRDHRPDLYETPFLLWTQAQAEALRRRMRGGGRIDWERVAEEVEDLGEAEDPIG